MMKRKTKVVNTLTTGIAHLRERRDRYEGLGSFVDANTVLVSGKEESTKLPVTRFSSQLARRLPL